MKNIKYSLFVLIAACSYGALSTVVKLAYQNGHAFNTLVLAQSMFGVIILFGFMLFFSRAKVDKKQVAQLMVAGITTATTTLFYFLSLNTVSASIAVVLLFQFTWIILIFEFIFEKIVPSKLTILSIVVLIFGSILASGLLNGGEVTLNPIGFLYGILAATSYALFIFISKKVATNVPSISRSFYMALGGFVLLFLILSPMDLYTAIFSSDLIIYGFVLGLFGSALPVFLFAIGTPHVPDGLSGILSAAELPVAIIASVLILNEAVTILQWIGIIIIFVGIIFPQLLTIKKKTA